MKRDIEKELLLWVKQKERYPLIVRGARQVGKSYLVEKFAKTHFQNIIILDFEFQPQLKGCFTTLSPDEIINKIQLILGVQINPSNTLLFFDEIQRSEEHTSELQSHSFISYAVFCLKKKNIINKIVY